MSFMLSARSTSAEETHNKLYELLAADGPDFEKTRYIACRGSAFTHDTIFVERGGDEYVIKKHGDGVWRWVSLTTYGNYSFVHGAGCDASGFVLTAELGELAQDLFDALIAEEGSR